VKIERTKYKSKKKKIQASLSRAKNVVSHPFQFVVLTHYLTLPFIYNGCMRYIAQAAHTFDIVHEQRKRYNNNEKKPRQNLNRWYTIFHLHDRRRSTVPKTHT